MYIEPNTDMAKLMSDVANAPIRITHIPTGLSAIGEGQGSQIANKEMALELLKKLLSRVD